MTALRPSSIFEKVSKGFIFLHRRLYGVFGPILGSVKHIRKKGGSRIGGYCSRSSIFDFLPKWSRIAYRLPGAKRKAAGPMESDGVLSGYKKGQTRQICSFQVWD